MDSTIEADTDPQQVGQRIEELLAELSGHAEPAVTETAEELVRLLMAMYGAGLARIVERLADPGQLRELARDELVSGLLVLHDLHPEDTATRAARALESVRPYLGSHAGDVELLGVEAEPAGPVVRLALTGSCDGCPSSSITVTTAIETAITEACPEVVRVDVAGLTEPTRSSGPSGKEPPLLQIGSRPPPDEVPVSWLALEPPALRPGQCAVVDVADHPVLFALPAGPAGALVAYRDECPSCRHTLTDAVLAGDELTCPSCAVAFDVRLAGRALDGSNRHLDPLPLVQRGGGWRLAVARTPAPRVVHQSGTDHDQSGLAYLSAGPGGGVAVSGGGVSR